MKRRYYVAALSLCSTFTPCFPLYLKHFNVGQTWNIFPSHSAIASFPRAVYSGDLDEVKQRLKHNPNVEEKDFRNFTPAHYSAIQGHTDCLKALLHHDASATQRVANHQGDKDRSPLHCAAFEGHSDCVKTLLDAGAKIDAKDDEELTPLHYAALKGNSLCVGILLEHDPSLIPHLVTLKGPDTITPLHCAAWSGDVTTIKLLLDHQASTSAKDEEGLMPVHYVVLSRKDNVECLDAFLQYDAKRKREPNHSNDSEALRENNPLSLTPGAATQSKIGCLNLLGSTMAKDGDGKTPLHYAAQKGCIQIARELIKNGANRLAKDNSGKLPLHYAVSCESPPIKTCVSLLLESQSEEQLNERDKNGNTPLHCLKDTHSEGIVHTLLAKGAKVTIINNDGEEPIHCACREGATYDKLKYLRRAKKYEHTTLKIVEALIEKKPSTLHINGATHQGETPYSIAAAGAHGSQIVALLAKKGATATPGVPPLFRAVANEDLDQIRYLLGKISLRKNFYLRTLLHCATLTGCIDMIKLLLEFGARVTDEDGNGAIPLHYAAAKGHSDIIKYLLLWGSNILKTDKFGRIPLQVAALRGHHHFVKELLSRDTANLQKAFLLRKKYSPLHLAIYQNDEAEIERLSSEGLPVDGLSRLESPLTLAVACGSVNATRSLLKYLANINSSGARGCTLMHLAASLNHEKIIELLLEKGANETLTSCKGFLPIEIAVLYGKTKSARLLLSRQRDRINVLHNGHTLLHLAAQKNQDKIIRLLLDHGADPTVQDSNGLRPLEIAVNNGYEKAARILLNRENSGTLNSLNHGYTLLHLAVIAGHLAIINLLIEYKVNQYPVSENGDDPLHLAALNGHSSVVQALLKRPAREIITSRNSNEQTPHDIAIAHKHEECAKILYKARITNKIVVPPLVRAVWHNHIEGVRYHLKKEADINKLYLRGATLLHIAVHRGHSKIAEFLLDNGATIDALNTDNKRPFHVAAQVGSHEAIGILLERGAQPDMPFLKNMKGAYQLRKFVRRKVYEIQAKKKSESVKDKPTST